MYNKPAMIEIMALHGTANKLLSESMMTLFIDANLQVLARWVNFPIGLYWLLAHEMISWADDRNLAMIYLSMIMGILQEYYRSVMGVY